MYAAPSQTKDYGIEKDADSWHPVTSIKVKGKARTLLGRYSLSIAFFLPSNAASIFYALLLCRRAVKTPINQSPVAR